MDFVIPAAVPQELAVYFATIYESICLSDTDPFHLPKGIHSFSFVRCRTRGSHKIKILRPQSEWIKVLLFPIWRINLFHFLFLL